MLRSTNQLATLNCAGSASQVAIAPFLPTQRQLSGTGLAARSSEEVPHESLVRRFAGCGAHRRDDGSSALPRSAVTERTTIFGLSPTAAVLIAAALLLVVILAIVAMTRSNDSYIDQRRL